MNVDTISFSPAYVARLWDKIAELEAKVKKLEGELRVKSAGDDLLREIEKYKEKHPEPERVPAPYLPNWPSEPWRPATPNNHGGFCACGMCVPIRFISGTHIQ